MRGGRSSVVGVVVAVIAAAVAGAIAFSHRSGASSGSSGTAPAAAVSVAPAPSGVRAGVMAPDFRGTAVDGSTIHLSDLRGRAVLVNFFASWCTNCVQEMPLLQRVANEDASRGLVVVGVNARETGDGRAFLRTLGVTYPAMLDPATAVGEAYGVDDLPVSVFVDRQGRVDRVIYGQLIDTVLEAELAKLLG